MKELLDVIMLYFKFKIIKWEKIKEILQKFVVIKSIIHIIGIRNLEDQ